MDYQKALMEIRGQLARFKPGNEIYDLIVAPRDEVLARFQPIFSESHLPELTADEFTPFLYFENNHHWTGLYRHGLGAAADMPTLRDSLQILLDESRPIAERLPKALELVTGMGKGIATAVLLVAYPDCYGVWNNTSEAGLRETDLWPEFERGDGTGGRYEKINAVLNKLSADLGIDLWTLDACWWYLLEKGDLPQEVGVPGQVAEVEVGLGTHFGLENQLEAFLVTNWDRTPLAEEWEIYSTPDEPDAGNQFPTDIGRIDVLAKHRREERFLIVELKRNRTTDQTVGQALRYYGWIKRHLATEGQSVEAVIIAHSFDEKALYAVSSTPHIRLMSYEIDFRLNAVESVD